jgi:PAS domain S-box-containing protein
MNPSDTQYLVFLIVAPLAIVVTAAAILIGITRFSFFKIRPIAKSVLFETITDGFVLLDQRTVIVDINSRAQRILGFTESPVGSVWKAGDPLRDAIARATEAAALESTIVATRDMRRSTPVVSAIKLRNGFSYEVSGSRIFDNLGRTMGTLIVLRDVSETTRLLEEKDALIARLTQAVDEIKALQGILPICMRCKKVRNDGGYWQRVDEYISSRSSVQFSHGYCPECAAEVMRELDKSPDLG